MEQLKFNSKIILSNKLFNILVSCVDDKFSRQAAISYEMREEMVDMYKVDPILGIEQSLKTELHNTVLGVYKRYPYVQTGDETEEVIRAADEELTQIMGLYNRKKYVVCVVKRRPFEPEQESVEEYNYTQFDEFDDAYNYQLDQLNIGHRALMV